MKTNHLEYILEVYNCGSINKAAKNLYLSQSSLSNIILSVENEVGYNLFNRNSSGITVTPEGKLFMLHAEKIIAESNNIKKIPETFKENSNISILCSPSSFITQCYFDFKRNLLHMKTQDMLLETGIREVINGVIARKSHIGILIMFEKKIKKHKQTIDKYNLEIRILKKDIPMMVFMSANHPISKKPEITIADISEHPFVTDANIDYDDTLEIVKVDNSQNILYTSDRSTTFDAIRKCNYISIGIKPSQADTKLFNFVSRPIKDFNQNMAILYIKHKTYIPNQFETSFIQYLSESLNKYYR